MHRRAGFSLLELSVVIAIIGLMAGGVMGGRNLLHTAQLRSVISDANRYRDAVHQFRDQYRYLPGDMPDATKYWGASVTNGNGNGILEYGSAASTASEPFQAWTQLALGGFIEGQYTGLSGGAGAYSYLFGTNSPGSRFAGVGWMLSYIDNSSGSNAYMFNYNYSNWLGIGGNNGSSDNTWADNGFLIPADAARIDAKLDDGMPATGMVHGILATGYGNCTTATGPTDHTAQYKLDNSNNDCALLFHL